jgi:hypothetical protein
VDSGRAISFVTLGTRDLPTLRSFYRWWGWTERDGSDEFAQFDVGGVRLPLYPLGLLRDEAAPDRELPPEDAGNRRDALDQRRRPRGRRHQFAAAVAAGARGVGASVDSEWGATRATSPAPEGNRWEIAWLPGYR